MLRLAKPTDAAAILAIYAPYIRETSLTFETEVPPLHEFADRISSYLINFPWLVYESNGQITGYAYAARHRERKAYQWAVETSIYIHHDFQQKGIARILYQALFRILKAQGFTQAYAVINLPNEKSVAFHEHCGFEYFATYKNAGYKLGQWKNVGWWLLQLNPFINEPPDPLPLSKIETALLLSPR